MNRRPKTFKRSKSANSLHLTDEGNFQEALKIHGIDDGNKDFSSDSDSGKSSLDEDYFKYRPGPIQVDTNKLVNIISKTNTGAVTKSFFHATKDASKIEATNCLPAQSVDRNEKQRIEEREKPQEQTIVKTNTFNRNRTTSLPDSKEFANQGPRTKRKLEHNARTRVKNVLKLAKQEVKLPLLTPTAYEKTEDLPVLSTQTSAIHSEADSRPAECTNHTSKGESKQAKTISSSYNTNSTLSSFVVSNTSQTEGLPKLTTYNDNILPLPSTASKYVNYSSSETKKGITIARSTNFKEENTSANLGFTSIKSTKPSSSSCNLSQTAGLPKSTLFDNNISSAVQNIAWKPANPSSKSETPAKTTIKNNYTKNRPSSSVDCNKVAQTIHNNAASANISINRPARIAKEANTSNIHNIENYLSSYISTVKNTQKPQISVINCEISNTNVVKPTNQIKRPIRSTTSQHGFKSTSNQTRPSNQFIRPYPSSDIRQYGSRSSGHEAERRSPSLASRFWRSILGCIICR